MTGTLCNPQPGVLDASVCSSSRQRAGSANSVPLRRLLAAYWPSILLTYFLFTLENGVRLVQPLALGRAVNGLLLGGYTGLGLLAAQSLVQIIITSVRQAYDTRTFTRIYNALVTNLVLKQRASRVGVSHVVARSVLSRELVDFFERDIPVVLHAMYTLVGALVMIGLYDRPLLGVCLLILVPTYLFNVGYGRRTLALNRQLNDQLEQEVHVIEQGESQPVQRHYERLALWRIKLSDWEAISFAAMGILFLGLNGTALVRSSTVAGANVGQIMAVFQYVTMLITGLANLPPLVQQLSRLRDIGRRVRVEIGGAAESQEIVTSNFDCSGEAAASASRR